MKSVKISSLLCVLVLTLQLFGQAERAVWGVVPVSDLEMQYCPIDSGASVYILSDFGECGFNQDLKLEIYFHRRIKIFDHAGFEKAEIKIMRELGDVEETISELRGCTYNLSKENAIVTTELKLTDIYTKKITEEREVTSFALPALQPGCIIEYSYKLTSPKLTKGNKWFFQSENPVRWSGYSLIRPSELNYSLIVRGEAKFDTTVQKDTIFVVERFLRDSKFGVIYNSWVAKNLPGLKPEIYAADPVHALLCVEMQVTGIKTSRFNLDIAGSWYKVADIISYTNDFDQFREPTEVVKNLAKEICNGKTTQMEKLTAIHTWIAKNIVTIEFSDLFRYQPTLDMVITEKKGSTADVNLLMTALLRCAEIACNPVVSSTSDMGKIQTVVPNTEQFNYLLTWVKVGEKYFGMDATSHSRKADLIPSELLNTMGFVIKDNSHEWVELISARRDTSKTVSEITILPDGSISGSVKLYATDYSAEDIRGKLQDEKIEDEIKELIDANPDNTVYKNLKITGQDNPNENVIIDAEFSSDLYCDAGSDLLYFNPAVFGRISTNPFLAKERRTGFDFGYQAISISISTFTLPDGYEVAEVPANCTYFSKESGLVYLRRISVNGREIKVERKFDVKTTLQPRDYYESIVSFHEKVIKADAEQIVLKKTKVSGQ